MIILAVMLDFRIHVEAEEYNIQYNKFKSIIMYKTLFYHTCLVIHIKITVDLY